MSTGENLARISAALEADASGNLTATNTPAQDDNTKKIATTEFIRNLFAGSGKQLATNNGYQKLPGGLIIQWGNISGPNGGVTSTVTFPIPFTSGPFVAIPVANSSADIALTVLNYTATTFQIKNNGSLNAAASFWIAIGV